MGCLGIQNRGDKKKTKKAREREKREREKRERKKRTNKQMNNGVLNEKNVMSGPEPRAWVYVEDEDNEQKRKSIRMGALNCLRIWKAWGQECHTWWLESCTV